MYNLQSVWQKTEGKWIDVTEGDNAQNWEHVV